MKNIRWIAAIFAGGILLGMLSGLVLGGAVWAFFYWGKGKAGGTGGEAGPGVVERVEEKRKSRVNAEAMSESIPVQGRKVEPVLPRKEARVAETPMGGKTGGVGTQAQAAGGGAGERRNDLDTNWAKGSTVRQWVVLDKIMGNFKTQIFTASDQALVVTAEQKKALEELKATAASKQIQVAARVLLREPVSEEELKASDAQSADGTGESLGSLSGLDHLLARRFTQAAAAYEAHAHRDRKLVNEVDAAMAVFLDNDARVKPRLDEAVAHASAALKAAEAQGLMKGDEPVGPAMNWMAIAQAVSGIGKASKSKALGDAAKLDGILTLERAQAVWRKVGEQDGVAWCYCQLGYVKGRDVRQGPGIAIEYFSQAAGIWKRETRPVLWGRMQAAMGKACRFSEAQTARSDLTKGAMYLEKALEVLTEENDPQEYVRANVLLMQILLMTEENRTQAGFERACAAGRAAQRVSTRADRPTAWASIEGELADGWAQRAQGNKYANIKHALGMYEGVLAVQENGPAHYLAQTHSQIGYLWLMAAREGQDTGSDLAKAAEAFRKAERIGQRDDKTSVVDLALTRARLGYTQMLLSQYPGQDEAKLRRDAQISLELARMVLAKEPRREGLCKEISSWLSELGSGEKIKQKLGELGANFWDTH